MLEISAWEVDAGFAATVAAADDAMAVFMWRGRSSFAPTGEPWQWGLDKAVLVGIASH